MGISNISGESGTKTRDVEISIKHGAGGNIENSKKKISGRQSSRWLEASEDMAAA